MIDMSFNQVFARCIYTSVAILLSILPMAISGGDAVENFCGANGGRRGGGDHLIDLHRRTDPAHLWKLVDEAASEPGPVC